MQESMKPRMYTLANVLSKDFEQSAELAGSR